MKNIKYFIFSLICIFSCSIVFAENEVIIKSITPIYDETSSIVVTNENNNHKVMFDDSNQIVKYSVVIENTTDNELKVSKFDLNTPSKDFVIYKLDGIDKNYSIKSKETKELILTIKTTAENNLEEDFDDELLATINFEKATTNIIDEIITNPNTSTKGLIIVLIFAVGVTTASIVIYKKNKLVRYVALILAFTSIVQVVKAQEIISLELKINVFYIAKQKLISTESPIALMNNYFPTIKKTGYSGITVSEISVYVENDGKLEIGTANVGDIVTSSTQGTQLTTNTKIYNVTKGSNTIAINLTISEEDTIVIGGPNSTVKIYSYSKVPNGVEYALYTNCNNKKSTNLISNEKLIISTNLLKTQSIEINPGLQEEVEALNLTSYVKGDAEKYFYAANTSAWENKTITHLNIPIMHVTKLDNPVVQIVVVNSSTKNIISRHNITIPSEEVKDGVYNSTTGYYTINKYINLKLDEPIITDENQTLGISTISTASAYGGIFKHPSSSYTWGDGKYDLIDYNNTNISDNLAFYFAIEGTAVEDTYVLYQEHLEKLQKEEDSALVEINKEKLSNVLNGKKVSILGDSISTYSGTASNASPWYPAGDVDKVEETWWMKLINTYNMELCVNNSTGGMGIYKSYTGSTTNQGLSKVNYLHTNTTTPDLIFVFIGHNDSIESFGTVDEIKFNELIVDEGDGVFTYKTPTTSAEAYAIAIHKMQQIYKNADIVLIELIGSNDSTRDAKNKVIKNLASHYKLHTVDLHNGGVDMSNSTYIQKGVHPNVAGMSKIADVIDDTLYKMYIK